MTPTLEQPTTPVREQYERDGWVLFHDVLDADLMRYIVGKHMAFRDSEKWNKRHRRSTP